MPCIHQQQYVFFKSLLLITATAEAGSLQLYCNIGSLLRSLERPTITGNIRPAQGSTSRLKACFSLGPIRKTPEATETRIPALALRVAVKQWWKRRRKEDTFG